VDEHTGVKERIAELHAERNSKSEKSRDECRQFLVDVIRAKPEDAAFDNPLCELVYTTEGRQVSFPSKLAAAAQLSKLCGWDDPTKAALGTDDELTALLIRIRRNAGGPGLEHADRASKSLTTTSRAASLAQSACDSSKSKAT
jgi:hypothetical protein